MTGRKVASELNINFSVIIKALREEAGLKQSEAAKKAGINPSYLCLIETEKCGIPSEPVLQCLAKVLDVDGDWLCLVSGRCPDDFMRRFLKDPKKACEVVRECL